MNNAWTKLGLKSQYETGELIVLVGAKSEPLPPKTVVLLNQEGKSEKIKLEAKLAPDGKEFFEFYALDPGTYQLQAQWGVASFSVVPRQGLTFQTEFGIFFAVVVALVLLMAKRYLGPKGRSNASN